MINSHSRIRSYKTCRRRYFFEYVEKIKPIVVPKALEQGSSYHDKVAQILNEGRFDKTNDVTDAMAYAFIEFILPNLPDVQVKDGIKCIEHKFLTDVFGVQMVGFVDALGADGIPIEHKTTSSPIDSRYRERLNWDEQVPTYCIMANSKEIRYTAIQKPTIRQRKEETMDEYIIRCIDWYEESPETRVGVFTVYRSMEELGQHGQSIADITKEMESCELFYRNPYACGGFLSCPFEPICLTYVPYTQNTLIGYMKKEE